MSGSAGAAAPAILVVTGLALEARLAASDGIVTLCGGLDRLREELAARMEADFRAVVSFGLAGGLDPALKPGDLVTGRRVLAGEGSFEIDETLRRHATDRLVGRRLRVLEGDVAGVCAPLLTPATKQALRAATGAAVVDMESQIAAAFARRRNLPLLVIRAVSDPARRTLPALAGTALGPEGRIDLPQVLGSLRRQPGDLGRIAAAACDLARGFLSLRRCRPLRLLVRGAGAAHR